MAANAYTTVPRNGVNCRTHTISSAMLVRPVTNSRARVAAPVRDFCPVELSPGGDERDVRARRREDVGARPVKPFSDSDAGLAAGAAVPSVVSVPRRENERAIAVPAINKLMPAVT